MAGEFDFPAVFTANLPNGDIVTAQDNSVIQVPYRASVKSKASLTPVKKASSVKAPVKKSSKVTNIQPNNPNISRTPGFNTGIDPVPNEELAKQTQVAEDQLAFDKNSQLYLSAAKFGMDVMNANSAYNALNASTQLNIMESRRLASDAIERGKQRALDARVEGQLAGGDAKLALAAQGQDVQGADVGKVVGSLEDISVFNGLQEETNSIREALGFELEEVSLEHQLDQAEISRDATILSSALNFGASYASTL